MAQHETVQGVRSLEQKTSNNQRFQQSLWQVPNRGLLFDYQFAGRRENLTILTPGYSLWFRDTMQMVKANCLAEQICDHSQPHVEQAARNGLVLLDIMQDTFQPGLLHPQLFSDPAIVFTLLVHDIGYASPNVTWENRYAIGHEAAGSQMIAELIESLPNGPTRSFLEPILPTILHAISTDTDNRAEIMTAVADAEQTLSQERIFTLLVMAADKVDYFRSGRIDNIPPPSTYAENPYYFLAWMVENYELVYDKEAKKLQYVVHLYGEDAFSLEERKERLAVWEREVRTYFPHVLQLLEGITQITGVKLVIEPGREVKESEL